jgi:DNA recombination protein RmuC
VLVSARRFRDLKIVSDGLAAPTSVEASPRPLTADELVVAAAEARPVRALPQTSDEASAQERPTG